MKEENSDKFLQIAKNYSYGYSTRKFFEIKHLIVTFKTENVKDLTRNSLKEKKKAQISYDYLDNQLQYKI